MKFEFNLEMFWLLGLICFVVIGLGNLYTTSIAWQYLDLGGKFAKTAGIIFNFVLAYFFFWMLKGSKKSKKEINNLKSDGEILKMFNDNEKKFFRK